MKRVFQLAVVLLAFLPAISFAQDKKAAWPEMKEFHAVMSTTFHPAEEGNFAPLKEKAEQLFEAAKKWQKSEIPANFKPTETKEALQNLVIKCGAVKKAVEAKKNDEELRRLITEAHDVFHTIAGECRRADD
ncbi:MAG: hypothetical protein IPP72_04225 [Chitinophagaceae bacterium]|nr:hypothetical protein [Chitinophagaceae bacterium]